MPRLLTLKPDAMLVRILWSGNGIEQLTGNFLQSIRTAAMNVPYRQRDAVLKLIALSYDRIVVCLVFNSAQFWYLPTGLARASILIAVVSCLMLLLNIRARWLEYWWVVHELEKAFACRPAMGRYLIWCRYWHKICDTMAGSYGRRVVCIHALNDVVHHEDANIVADFTSKAQNLHRISVWGTVTGLVIPAAKMSVK